MRKQFVNTVSEILNEDTRTMLLLCDIGVWGFKEAFKDHSDRVYNLGILEQSTIGLSAGLAIEGFIPIVHTIAPFLVERAYEQLKDDFGYQKMGGNFVSVGASYDYAALGCTHHCPADVGILKNIPGMEIVLPGTAKEFDRLFREAYANGHPTYFRLSERQNPFDQPVKFGQANVIQTGSQATVVAVGPMLKMAMEACAGLDVTLLYYTTLFPFDAKTLSANCVSGRVLLCEPYYHGALATDIIKALAPRSIVLDFVGVPHEFLTHYGKVEEHDVAIKITANDIFEKIKKIINL